MSGKHEPLTPKAIAKRIKAKGLQRLRWYCQMCEKQCRDANGFKCHIESEAHQRQMQLYSSHSGKYNDQFSREFEAGFMDIVKRRYRTKRVHANVVYNEYIRDRNHTHMNATRWVTLTGFVLYLGKTGKCKVEETPKGWYLQYIERDPELLEKQEKLAKKQQMELNDEERMQMEIEKRLQLAKQQAVSSSITPEATELKRDDNSDFKISFSLATTKKTEASTTTTTASPKEEEIETVDYNPEEGEELDELDENSPPESDLPTSPEQVVPSEPKGTQKVEEKPVEKVQSSIEQIPTRESSIKKREKPETPRPEKEETSMKKKKMTAMEEIALQEERKKEFKNRKDYWLTENIVVKVINKELADGKYYKQKGVVKKVIDKYVALVKMIDSGDLLKLDQGQLETVIPALGSRVRIVNGAYRGEEASLLALNTDKFKAQLRLETGPQSTSTIFADYEDICKLS